MLKMQNAAIIFFLLIFSMNIFAMQELFTNIYNTNYWGDPESFSGSGSNLTQTATIRKEIPTLLRKLSIKKVLDIPCGDFNWMKEIDLSFLDNYYGADIVQALIENNQKKYAKGNTSFMILDLVNQDLPQADLILCRDVFVHFRFSEIRNAIKNFKRSGAKYLLTTTFTKRRPNTNFSHLYDWRTLNLQLPPFHFPEPILLINENCTESKTEYSDKSLGLWLLDDIHLD